MVLCFIESFRKIRFSNMTDSMKFGPEWLRNLSSEGSTQGAPKYQLAEHRYGREEMLALFDRNVRAPDSLVKIQGLYVEKTQTPMALLSMTEEETKQWNRCINSDAVLRLPGKAPLGPPSGMRGRGISVDRGRGRGRLSSGGYHYPRGLSYDEQSEGGKEIGPPERGFSRGSRSFDRSQVGDRNWSERNGGDSGDWNGSTSPRKEFSSLKDFSGGGRSGIDNWRRHRGSSEDEEGWRKMEKWGRSNSWRDEGDAGDSGLGVKNSRGSSWGRGWADEATRGRGCDDDYMRRPSGMGQFMDEVPEWATENPSESGGCFDATGAFHGGSYSDEEEEEFRASRNRVSENLDTRTKSKSPPPGKEEFEEDEFEEQGQSPKNRKLSRSQTAQGNLSESSAKSAPSPMSKSRSSSNLKSEQAEATPSKRIESQNFDRLRVLHQNFVDKPSTNKEVSDSDEVNDTSQKKEAVEPNCVSDEIVNSEGGLDNRNANDRDNNCGVTDSVNKVNSGARMPEEEAAERGVPVNRQGSEEDMERMAEVVKDTVVKLFEDDENPPVNVDNDKWYYRDPQGVVQGPFRSSEMLEWFMNGYFQLSLLLRRERDEVYVKLGDLMQKCGKVPFLPGVNFPVLKADSDLSQQQQPPNLSQPDILMQQYHQYQILQKQILLSQQLALSKLSQSEMWNTLSPLQQRSLLMQKLNVPQPPIPVEQIPQMDSNPLSQLISQMQQQNKLPMPEPRENTNNVDPIRQLLQQMSIMQSAQMPMMAPPINPSGVVLNHQLAQQAHLNTMINNANLNPAPQMAVEENKVENPIQSLLRQLGNQSNLMPHPPAPTDSLWGAPGRPQSWTQGNQPVPTPASIPLWEIKTEQQILAEQQMRLEEERKKEEIRKLQEEEEAKKQKELEKKMEEIKKLEKKLVEEARARQQKGKEEKKKAEELKKKEEMQKKKQQEELKKQEEAQRKKEEKEKKKEEERERKRLLEEEKKKAENERRKKEEEMMKKKQEEEEEAARRQEQQKRQVEALRRLQEQQLKSRITTWSQSNVTTGTSLADIQKLQEKEKKQMQLIRDQQAVVQQIAHQNEIQQMQREAESRSNGFNLKWAEKMPKVNQNVKSLAEIQAEEQLQLAKQMEKERLERLQQQRETSIPSNAGIWSSQSLTWNNSNSPWAVNPPQQNSTPGFWDEVAPVPSKTKAKAASSSPLKTKNQPAANQKQGNANTGSNTKGSKSKPKKGEASIMKLFEPQEDEFTSWCTASLESIQTDVDIPTFVIFLRDIESPYDVEDYVKLYLGDGKEAQEFAKQFVERRSRWRSSKKANTTEDDLCTPSFGLNPPTEYQSTASQEFQEVKGKGKKSKKGKMLKVDNRILGFSVTAAHDRINIGDRDYVVHNS
ncbi:UNVERIFIED_CONTAM: hypothetical protein PYX00_004675 [Menopon gallinae]|uniref:GYF domain-containing protein n=2 Tax=Menopon gallinae TaxID=328185 RepID=A0AAW2I4R3_9NEOP